MFGALPVALLVKSPGVLALVSQASVAFVFFFAAVVAVLSLSPTQHNGKLHLAHAVPHAPEHISSLETANMWPKLPCMHMVCVLHVLVMPS